MGGFVMDQESYIVPAVERAFDILRYIGDASQSVSVRELSIKLDIPPASCFRIVKNLVLRGYLIEDYSIPGQFSLGFNLLKLSSQLLRKLDVRSIAVNFMRQIAIKTNHVVQLGVLHENGVMYVEQILPGSPISIIAPLMTILPINVSASGKVLTAFLSLHMRVDFLRNAKFECYTKNSIVDKTQFIDDLENIKSAGYALDIEEYSIGIGCIAVPIFDYNRNCVAALGITGPVSDYVDNDKRSAFTSLLTEFSTEISKRIGYCG
jgi:DNA-binding IclR family transcriptional regulator